MKTLHFVFILYIINYSSITNAQNITLSPANWWTGMKHNKVTIVAENIPVGLKSITISNSSVEITDHYSAKNKSFRFIEINVPDRISPHTAQLTFNFINTKPIVKQFDILARNEIKNNQSLSPEDVIYQIIPDRFCNANEKNDQIREYFEKADRLNPIGIHGGDIEGITQNLPYISELGCTAIELLPVIESNLMLHSYERMAATNFYAVDKRLGSMSDYKSLVNSCDANNLKLIQSIVLNQIGKQHPLFANMADPDFFNATSYEYTDELINKYILVDPFATSNECLSHRNRWERSNYPTINQTNEVIQNIMIQQALWWIETTHVQSFKIEQTSRNTPEFIGLFAQAIYDEYPQFELLFDYQVPANYATRNTNLAKEPFLIDNQYPKKLSDAFSLYREEQEGVNDLYDFALESIHKNRNRSINMLDNHLLTRAFTNADSDANQMMMMLGHLLTAPGIPSISYGTEWLLKGNIKSSESDVRKDFPGGWMNDSHNGFTAMNISKVQIDFNNQIKMLLNWRKSNSELFIGDFYHSYPENNIYTYIRKTENKSLLIVINNSEMESYQLKTSSFDDLIGKYNWCTEIVNGDRYKDYQDIITQPKSISIIELSN